MKIYISPSDQKSNVGVGSYGTEADRMQQLSNYLPLIPNQKMLLLYSKHKYL